VIVSVVGTEVVTVTHDGVEVTVDVCVIVGMLRRLLQKGVATFWAFMMVTMAWTAGQLLYVRSSRLRSSRMGEARADATRAAAARSLAIAKRIRNKRVNAIQRQCMQM
jgi:hypothetical protein